MKMKKAFMAFALTVPAAALTAHAAEPPPAQKTPAQKTPAQKAPVQKAPVQKVPSVLPKQPSGPISHRPVIRILTSLRYDNGYMEIGEEKDIYATLTRADGTPIVGKTISFNLYDENGKLAIPLQSAVTTESGRATVVRARIVERPGQTLRVGQYTMRTEFSGDAELMAARGAGSFLVQKGSTRCKVGKSRDGAATAYLLFAKASSGGVDELPASEVPTFTINGAATSASSWRWVGGGWQSDWGLQGSGPWKVEMVYAGSALYHPCAGERIVPNSNETTYGGPH